MILRDEITVKTLVTVGWDSHGEEITEEVERGPLPAHLALNIREAFDRHRDAWPGLI